MAALRDFGFGGLGLSVADFTAPDQIVQLGNPPSRVDLLTAITGLSWDEVADSAVQGTLGGGDVRFIGRDALITNKRATGRTCDLADIESLGL